MSGSCDVTIRNEARVPRQMQCCPSNLRRRRRLEAGHGSQGAIVSSAHVTSLVRKDFDPEVQKIVRNRVISQQQRDASAMVRRKDACGKSNTTRRQYPGPELPRQMRDVPGQTEHGIHNSLARAGTPRNKRCGFGGGISSRVNTRAVQPNPPEPRRCQPSRGGWFLARAVRFNYRHPTIFIP